MSEWFINFMFGFTRFIRLPLILSDQRPQPGPASKTFYCLPSHLAAVYPEANHPPELRSELSLAYSRVHLLKPHAIITSYLEGKPLSAYTDPEAVSAAALLYTLPTSPASDLSRSQAEVAAIWRQYYRDQGRRIRQLRSHEQKD